MIGYRADIKKMFFDRAAVVNAVDKVTRKALSKVGSFVMRGARSSIRPARRKSLGEMAPQERANYEQWAARQKARGFKPPPRPLASSKPGEPPRSITGLLRRNIFFAYDPARESVVIGPAMLNRGTQAPETLEYGGSTEVRGRNVKIEARPFMGPALEREAPKLPGFFADAKIGP